MPAINLSPFNRIPPLMLAIGIALFLTAHCQADITTDGSLGRAVNLRGPDYGIGQELGLTIGKNLFHSFDRFNVHSGESATFTGPDTLDNVISRITGGSVSTIDGLLRSEVGTADFFFINPAGVVFGPNARVDVPAAFHVSTADELRFAGGSVFSASNPAASTLTAAAPDSFGYLGTRSASLVVNGSQLEFAPERTVSLSGQEMVVQGEDTDPARIVVPDGELRIFAAGNAAGSMPLAGELQPGTGRMDVTHAIIKTSGDGGGELRIAAGEATVTHSTLAANTIGASSVTGPGHAGTVKMRVTGLLEIVNGGIISSDTYASGDAGSVEIEAGNLRIDRQESSSFTGISSDANSGSSGNAGRVTINTSDLLEVLNGGIISSDTYASGNAGSVEIEAGNLRVDGRESSRFTRISSDAKSNASGNAGTIKLRVANLLEVLNGGRIESSTSASGDAGGIGIEAGNLCIDRQESSNFTGIWSDANPTSSGDAGTVAISVAELIEVLGGGQISSATYGTGDAGGVQIEAGNLRIDRQESNNFTGIWSDANPTSSGDAGTVAISVAELIEVLGGGQISSATYGTGDAGGVQIEAENLRINQQGTDHFTGIWSDASPLSSGNAGTITISVADRLDILNGGQISSDTWGAGNAGKVEIEAESLRIDRQGANYFTGIASSAQKNASGNGDRVMIRVTDMMEVLNGGQISSATFGPGDAGGIEIEAGSLRIDGQDANYFLTGIKSNAAIGSSGDAGTVAIKVADLLEVLNGGQILNSTFASGEAGGIQIEAGCLRIDGIKPDTYALITSSAEFGSSGNAGKVTIQVTDLLEIRTGGQILSSTFATGDAHGVEIEAGRLHIDGQGTNYLTGILSTAEVYSFGNAGAVTISVNDLLEMSNGGAISSNTWAFGDAGSVFIQAGEILIDGQKAGWPSYIASASAWPSQGFSGDVDIEAGKVTIRNGGAISIETHQLVSEEKLLQGRNAHLFVNSPEVTLDQGAWISAQSWGNVPAATIDISADNISISGNSSISTSSTEADGGPITLQGDIIDLRDSLITSSVEGLTGDGGDITITGDGEAAAALILEGGFIQANAPAGARGGDIFIDVRAVIPEGGNLEIGGQERQSFTHGSGKNIIQAAAPGGEQGSIRITSPELDISASLVTLDSGFMETLRLAADPCLNADSAEGSSLVFSGSGGVPAGPDQHAALYFDENRLDGILTHEEKKKHGDSK